MQNLLICSCQSVSEAFCASVCQMTRLLVSDSGCHCLLSCHQTFRTFVRHMLICPLQVKPQLTLSGLTLALPLIIDILRKSLTERWHFHLNIPKNEQNCCATNYILSLTSWELPKEYINQKSWNAWHLDVAVSVEINDHGQLQSTLVNLGGPQVNSTFHSGELRGAHRWTVLSTVINLGGHTGEQCFLQW